MTVQTSTNVAKQRQVPEEVKSFCPFQQKCFHSQCQFLSNFPQFSVVSMMAYHINSPSPFFCSPPVSWVVALRHCVCFGWASALQWSLAAGRDSCASAAFLHPVKGGQGGSAIWVPNSRGGKESQSIKWQTLASTPHQPTNQACDTHLVCFGRNTSFLAHHVKLLQSCHTRHN